MVDTRGDQPRLLAGASSSWLGPQVWRSDDLGATWQETPNGAVRFPEDTDAKVERVWQLVAGRRARRRLRRHRAGRGLQVRPTAARRSPSSGRCGTTRTARSGTPVSAARPSTRSCRTRPTPTRSRPRSRPAASTRPATAVQSWEPRNHGIRAEFLPEGQQYPEFGQCVHKVSRHPSRPERLFLQNHGGVYRSDDHGAIVGVDRRRSAGGVRLLDRRAPARARHRLRLPDQRRRRPLPARRQGPGVAVPGRRRHLGGARQGPAGLVLRRRDARRDVHRRPRPRPASTSAPATAGSGARPTTARPGSRWSATCPT